MLLRIALAIASHALAASSTPDPTRRPITIARTPDEKAALLTHLRNNPSI